MIDEVEKGSQNSSEILVDQKARGTPFRKRERTKESPYTFTAANSVPSPQAVGRKEQASCCYLGDGSQQATQICNGRFQYIVWGDLHKQSRVGRQQ